MICDLLFKKNAAYVEQFIINVICFFFFLFLKSDQTISTYFIYAISFYWFSSKQHGGLYYWRNRRCDDSVLRFVHLNLLFKKVNDYWSKEGRISSDFWHQTFEYIYKQNHFALHVHCSNCNTMKIYTMHTMQISFSHLPDISHPYLVFNVPLR